MSDPAYARTAKEMTRLAARQPGYLGQESAGVNSIARNSFQIEAKGR